jgi:hypothetical protein
MSQATHARTTNPFNFQSGRTRPAPTELQTALSVLKAQIRSVSQPYEPRFEADTSDVADWADHLDEVLGAAFAYARAVTTHLGDLTPA